MEAAGDLVGEAIETRSDADTAGEVSQTGTFVTSQQSSTIDLL